jgi:hypothetical protein
MPARGWFVSSVIVRNKRFSISCVYVEHESSTARFRWVKAPTDNELTQLIHTIAHRLARYLERQGLLEQDAEHGYLALESADEDPMDQLRGHSITSATAPALLYLLHPCSRTVLPWVLSKVVKSSPKAPTVGTLQTLPDERDAYDAPSTAAGNVAGFSLHAGVSAKANQRDKLERLCRYIALQGCRVLRRLGTIASAPDRPSPKNVCH